jgi:hypothetical protein
MLIRLTPFGVRRIRYEGAITRRITMKCTGLFAMKSAVAPTALRSLVVLAAGFLVAPRQATAQVVSRVSVDSSGAEADGSTIPALISADGRFVLLVSLASNLVANDTNGVQDVFVHDRSTGITECVSVDPSGSPGNLKSGGFFSVPSISADGRFVSFVSDATNLLSNLKTSGSQIFVRDRSTGITELASVDSSGIESGGFCENSWLSADGSVVAFDSVASNLVAGDTNGCEDVFVHDRATGVTERVNVDSAGKQGNRGGYLETISADGQFVSFTSASTNLVPGDTNHVEDAFVHDRRTGATERVSVDSTGVEGDDATFARGFSSDGQIVVMTSLATNLVSNDTNGTEDVFIRDRARGVTERVSVDSTGGESNGFSDGMSVSADGRIVAFHSDSTNLVGNDTNGVSDVFVHDRTSGITTRRSVDSSGAEANGESYGITISADGQVISFSSSATNLVGNDTNGVMDAFVRDERMASWSNYDSGLAGTTGVPALTASANPVLGATITVDLANSYGQPTLGLFVVGYGRASIPTRFGGDLLVVPALIAPITFSYGGDSFVGAIPGDFAWCGFTIDLQGIEADPGAAAGVSFSQGLELTIGN